MELFYHYVFLLENSFKRFENQMEQNTARPLVKEGEMVNKFVLVRLRVFPNFPYSNSMNTILLIGSGFGNILYTLDSSLNMFYH